MRQVLLSVFFVLSGVAQINAASDQMNRCVQIHDTLFYIALGGGPVEPMADYVAMHGRYIYPGQIEYLTNHVLRSIFEELGKSVYNNKKPLVGVSRRKACDEWNVGIFFN